MHEFSSEIIDNVIIAVFLSFSWCLFVSAGLPKDGEIVVSDTTLCLKKHRPKGGDALQLGM